MATRTLNARAAPTPLGLACWSALLGLLLALGACGTLAPLDAATREAHMSQAVPLSTVRQNFAETSRIGMHRLLRALDGHAPGTANRKLQAQLIIRESSQITPAN